MSEDELMELVLEAGAEDFAIEDSHYEIITAPEDYVTVRDAIDGANIPVLSGDITMLPSNYTEVPADKAKSMQKLLDALEEDDDVQNVYSNMAQ